MRNLVFIESNRIQCQGMMWFPQTFCLSFRKVFDFQRFYHIGVRQGDILERDSVRFLIVALLFCGALVAVVGLSIGLVTSLTNPTGGLLVLFTLIYFFSLETILLSDIVLNCPLERLDHILFDFLHTGADIADGGSFLLFETPPRVIFVIEHHQVIKSVSSQRRKRAGSIIFDIITLDVQFCYFTFIPNQIQTIGFSQIVILHIQGLQVYELLDTIQRMQITVGDSQMLDVLWMWIIDLLQSVDVLIRNRQFVCLVVGMAEMGIVLPFDSLHGGLCPIIVRYYYQRSWSKAKEQPYTQLRRARGGWN